MPLDPDCPKVIEFRQGVLDDPITQSYSMGEELSEAFDRKHMMECTRCQEHGAANIEVEVM